MRTAWDPRSDDDLVQRRAAEGCPRCAQTEHREHLLQTKGVAFYRCGSCGHMFIVRDPPPEQTTS